MSSQTFIPNYLSNIDEFKVDTPKQEAAAENSDDCRKILITPYFVIVWYSRYIRYIMSVLLES